MLTLNQKEGWKKSENGYASTKEGFSLKKDGHLWKSQFLRDLILTTTTGGTIWKVK